MHSLPPPPPEDGTEPVKVLDDDWGGYSDPKSGRMFYFNKTTRETTWKPPRITKPSADLNVQVPAPESPDSKVGLIRMSRCLVFREKFCKAHSVSRFVTWV